MHPAFSVLFFTVTSGFGYGFLFCLLLNQSMGWLSLERQTFLSCVAIATIVFTLGLLSSTQHLANPKNAWRSFVRFRTSWLSREAVLAIIGYPIFTLAVAALYFDWPSGVISLTVAISLLLIVALVYCTAMIYASLKTIPQWHTAWVPVAFMLFAASSGLVCLGQALEWQSPVLKFGVLLLLAVSLVVKLFYFRYVGKPTRSSINTATSFSQAKVTLFDSGHSSKNFLQREFVYEVGPQTTTLARVVSLLLAFVVPAILIGVWLSPISAWVAIASMYIGLLLERWLFFVEAKHVVRHYYGV